MRISPYTRMLNPMRIRKGRLSVGAQPFRHLAVFFWAPLLLFACAHPLEQGQGPHDAGPPGSVPVQFRYTDAGAREVALVASFNRWSPQPMSRTGENWSVTVFLSPGRYGYAFLVDGKVWRRDPGGLVFEDNGFGDRNSILTVE